MTNKKLEDMTYEDLIAEAVGYTVNSMCRGETIKEWNRQTIDLTISWLRAKGKMKD